MGKIPELVFFNGQIIPYKDAMIHAMSPCVKYGATIFEGIRCYWNDSDQQLYLFRLEEHSKRLLQSAKLSRMYHKYTFADIMNANVELLKALQFKEDLHIRQMMYIDGDGELSSTGPVGLISVALPRQRSEGYETGVKVGISSWTRIDDSNMPPRIKAAANYQNGKLGTLQAKMDGYDTAVFLNSRGKITEGSGACIFLVKDSKLITPSTTSGILESITRDTLIKIAQDEFSMEVQEREVDRTELYITDEAFFCGSGAEVKPIISADQHQIGDGQVGQLTLKLRKKYLEITRGFDQKYSNWLTPVY